MKERTENFQAKNKKANPQVEDGYVQFAIEIVEQLSKLNLRPYEWRTLWALWRKTWGWHKKEDKISITQFEKLTGIKRRHQHEALKTLQEKNIITCKSKSYIKTYNFQKDYTQWKPLLKQVIVKTVTQTGNRPLLKQVTKPLLKQVNTKDKRYYTKEREKEEFIDTRPKNWKEEAFKAANIR